MKIGGKEVKIHEMIHCTTNAVKFSAFALL